MKKASEIFKNRLIQFTLEIVKLTHKLRKNQANIIFTTQAIRSGSSIGANYQEAQVAHTNKEFIQRLGISLKEANETLYWLELIEAYNKVTPSHLKKRKPRTSQNTHQHYQNIQKQK